MGELDPGAWRDEAPLLSERCYLDHAAMAPLPTRSVAAGAAVFQAQAARGAPAFLDWLEVAERTRASGARLLGAAPEEVVLVQNTAAGLSLVAEALPWEPGDAALVSVPDFPSLVYPLRALERRGVRCVPIARGADGRLDAAAVDAALGAEPRAKLVAVSSVDYATGSRADLAAIGAVCRTRGVRFAVDAIQSLGLVPTDVREIGCDFLCAGGHKWLLGPAGAGLLFVARCAWDALAQVGAGWKSAANELDFSLGFQLKPDPRRLEAGTPPFATLAALGASLELLLEVDPRRAFPHVLALTDRLATGLRAQGHTVVTPWGEGERAGIVSFAPRGEAPALLERLAAAGVSISLRDGRLRASPHFWNDAQDIDRLLAAL